MLGRAVADEAKLAELVAKARQVRKPLPRWLWGAAIGIGVACVAAFAWIYLQPAGTPTTPPRKDVGGPGFATGLAIGALAGFLIGWALARQPARADHSSRNSP